MLMVTGPGAEIGKVETSALETLLNQGVVGSLCVLLIATVVFLAKALMKAHQDRVTDLTTYAQKIKEGNEAMYDLVAETSKAVAHNSSETVLSNREVTTKVAGLESKITGMEQAVTLLKEQQIRLEVAIERGRK